MSIDAQIAALWTLICILVGALITLVLVAVMGDRGDPGPDEEPEPIDPDPQREADERDFLAVQELWLREHVTEPFEAQLLPRGRVAIRIPEFDACPTCGETGDGHYGIEPADTFWDCDDPFHAEVSA